MNFLRVHKWYYGEEKITLTEINKIIKARYKAEDPDYKNVLKYHLPAIYKEFQDIFFKK